MGEPTWKDKQIKSGDKVRNKRTGTIHVFGSECGAGLYMDGGFFPWLGMSDIEPIPPLLEDDRGEGEC